MGVWTRPEKASRGSRRSAPQDAVNGSFVTAAALFKTRRRTGFVRKELARHADDAHTKSRDGGAWRTSAASGIVVVPIVFSRAVISDVVDRELDSRASMAVPRT